MSIQIGELTIEEAAQQAAGNWRHFSCFYWNRRAELRDADKWAIIYTHNRDSGLLDQSNSAAIEKSLKKFAGRSVVFESHNHWAVGHVDGFSIRVFHRGQITKAFRTYHELAERLAEYPILDEADYSNREYVATLENIVDAAWRLRTQYDLPKDWECDVYSWLADHRCHAVENVDDRGGYPTEEDLEAAFAALRYRTSEEKSE